MIVILGLDLATVTGWSVFTSHRGKPPGLLATGIIDCSIKPGKDPAGRRFQLLWDGLGNICESLSAVPNVIYYERAVGGPAAGGPAAMVALGMSALVEQWAYTSGMTAHSVSAGTVKKHATGNGQLTKTTKMEMVEAALRRFGKRHLPRRTPTLREPWEYDDNVADAMWIGHYGACLESRYEYVPDRGRE
jgi:hypothetical protein